MAYTNNIYIIPLSLNNSSINFLGVYSLRFFLSGGLLSKYRNTKPISAITREIAMHIIPPSKKDAAKINADNKNIAKLQGNSFIIKKRGGVN